VSAINDLSFCATTPHNSIFNCTYSVLPNLVTCAGGSLRNRLRTSLRSANKVMCRQRIGHAIAVRNFSTTPKKNYHSTNCYIRVGKGRKDGRPEDVKAGKTDRAVSDTT
jgi:hypothetical protein